MQDNCFNKSHTIKWESFVSRNVAEKLAGLGNKVLLIDSDYKRGDQHSAFGLKKINLKEFFEINDSSIENYKIKEKIFTLFQESRE